VQGGGRGVSATPWQGSVPVIRSVLPGLFCNDQAELHQETSHIIYYDLCLPIYLLHIVNLCFFV
jgi:hypothetical protein